MGNFAYTLEYGEHYIFGVLCKKAQLGVRQRRLRHRHLRADPEEQAAFVIDLNLLLQDWPDEWELLFVDAATVRRHLTLSARWCPADDIPGVPQDDEQA